MALPALSDNYIWLLHDGRHALVVDPGDPLPVLQALQAHKLALSAIIVTHHHADHTAGIEALRFHLTGEVWGPGDEPIPGPHHPLTSGEQIVLPWLTLEVMRVPGHTAGHLAYYLAPQCEGAASADTVLDEGQDCVLHNGAVFTGDTLFSAGCGRLLEGTPAQMLSSLDRLAALPAKTLVYCAHEYTLSNLRFACALEPANVELASYARRCRELRDAGLPTLPSTIGLEKCINPFLRTRKSTIIEAVSQHDLSIATDQVAIFTALRRWKDQFK